MLCVSEAGCMYDDKGSQRLFGPKVNLSMIIVYTDRITVTDSSTVTCVRVVY